MWISYPPRNIYAGSTLPMFYISCLGYQEGKMYKRLKKNVLLHRFLLNIRHPGGFLAIRKLKKGPFSGDEFVHIAG